MNALDEVLFWQQVLTDAQRTVVCSPDLESRVKGWVTARQMDHVITVQASTLCPDDQIWIVDQHAMEASLRQDLQPKRWRL